MIDYVPDPATGDKYVQRYVAIGRSTERITEAMAERTVAYIAEQFEEKPLPFTLCPGPNAAWQAVKQEVGVTGPDAFFLPGYQGCLMAHLAAWGKFSQDILGCKIEGLDEFDAAIQESYLVWALPTRYILCDRPSIMSFNENDELHNETGPAIKFLDGWGRWFINDTPVDEQIVLHPQTQTIKQIMGDENADRRAIRCSRFGYLPLLEQTKAKLLDEYDNIIEGTLESLFKTNLGFHLFVATDPSNDIVAFPVPVECVTCEQTRLFSNGGLKLNVLGRT